MATGAAIAAGGSGRRVVSLQADGPAMYSLQALWTQARERRRRRPSCSTTANTASLIGEYKRFAALAPPPWHARPRN